MLNQRAEQTHLKGKTQLLSEHLSKHTVCCLMWVRHSAMSSRSLAQLSLLVVAPTADNMPRSTRVDAVCLAQAKKALAVCFNYPHAGSPHWAPYVKAGPHPSPCQTAVQITWSERSAPEENKISRWTMNHEPCFFGSMLMPLVLIRKHLVLWIGCYVHFPQIPQVTCCLLYKTI